MYKIHSWWPEEKKWYDIQWRIKSRDLRNQETRWKHNKQNQSQISSFDGAVLSCTSESFKRKEARRSTMARRPLESNRRQEKSTEAQRPSLDLEQVAERLAIQNFSVGDRVDRTAGTWTTSRRSTSPTTRPITKKSWYESTITMKSNDPNSQSGPMWKREDYRAITKAVLSLCEEQGRTNTYIPKKWDQAEKHGGPRTARKTGKAEPRLENMLLNADIVLFFFKVAELVGRHSMARWSMERSQMVTNEWEWDL